jgi:uncharacterized membrane protein
MRCNMADVKKSDDNLMAALAYLLSFVTGIVIYLLNKDKGNKFVLFHAMQAIIYGVAVFALFIGLGIVGMVMAFIPWIGWMIGLLMIPVWGILVLGNLGLWIFLMYKAYSGEKFKIPMIGNMAEKYAG